MLYSTILPDAGPGGRVKPAHVVRPQYHCTTADFGPRWTAARVCPRFVGPREPRTPRLCVAPSVPGCFAARLFDQNQPVWVYRTVRPHRGNGPVGVWDAPLTGERWLVPPVELDRVGVVPGETALAIGLAASQYVRSHRSSNVRIRAALYILAVERLPAEWVTDSDRARAEKARRLFAIGPCAETYIWERV